MIAWRRLALPLTLCCLTGCTAAELSSSGADGSDVTGDRPTGDSDDNQPDAETVDQPVDTAGVSDPDVASPDLPGATDPDLAPELPPEEPVVDGPPDVVAEPDPVVEDPIVTPDVEPEPGNGIPASCRREGALDCSPGPGHTDCDLDVGPLFGNTVNQAIDAVIAAHPEWFDTTEYGMPSPGVVLGMGGDYVRAVAAEVSARGLCAIQDPNASPGNEMGVKLNNACAESYNILTSWGQVRRPPGAHIATCWPGWF